MALLGPSYPSIDLNGAVVAITGGARGIGRATAQAFVEKGARVAVGDLDLEAARATAAAFSPTVTAFGVDVSSKDSFQEFLSDVDTSIGPVDVLVNNAGVMPIARFLDEDERVSATTMNVNVWGPIHGMRLVLPGMIERGRGHVVNVASLCGKAYLPALAVYSASKYAVVGLTAAVRSEVADTGVSVSAVLPSMVNTELASGIQVPGFLAAEPEDIAQAIVDSVRTRRGEIAVPQWVGTATTLTNLLPAPLHRLTRKAIRDDRGLAANDRPERRLYLERVAKQASEAGPR